MSESDKVFEEIKKSFLNLAKVVGDITEDIDSLNEFLDDIVVVDERG